MMMKTESVGLSHISFRALTGIFAALFLSPFVAAVLHHPHRRPISIFIGLCFLIAKSSQINLLENAENLLGRE